MLLADISSFCVIASFTLMVLIPLALKTIFTILNYKPGDREFQKEFEEGTIGHKLIWVNIINALHNTGRFQRLKSLYYNSISTLLYLAEKVPLFLKWWKE